MILLLLSVAILVAAPLFYNQLRRGGVIARAVDRGFALVMGGLALLVLLPETVRETHWQGVLLLLAGYLAPMLVEHGVHKAARLAHIATLTVAAIGMGMHSVLDGVVLAAAESLEGTVLPLVIILHRFTVGMVLWFILEPAFGRRICMAVLVFVGVATILGYLLAPHFGTAGTTGATAYLQAVILGTVLHGLVHRNHLAKPGHEHAH